MAKSLEYNATLTARIDLEPTLSIFRIKPDVPLRSAGDTNPWFVPGQYVTIGLNREGAAEDGGDDDSRPASVRRPMSIASAPEDGEEIEFYIRKVGTPESTLPLTHLMWPIKTGDRLFCRTNATGKFTVEDTVGVDDSRMKVMLAAGTGLAPFVSIARSRVLRDPEARLDDLAILHGASYPSSLGYREELEGLARDNGLNYIPTISRPKQVEGWSGFEGRAEALFGPVNLAQTEQSLGLGIGGLKPKNAIVLICGLQGTIAVSIKSLLSRGYVPDNRKLRRALEVDPDVPSSVFWEQYDNTPVIDVKDEALMQELRTSLHAALG